jgi:hypothetical protein
VFFVVLRVGIVLTVFTVLIFILTSWNGFLLWDGSI